LLASDTLPIVDFSALGASEAADLALARELDGILRTIGFCYFRNIEVSQELVDGLFRESARFHSLPEGEKRRLAMNAAHRGYMAPNSSVIVTSTVANVRRPNYSESLMIMHEVEPSDPRYGTEVHGPNMWQELAGFREAVGAYEAAMRGFCMKLLRSTALALDLPADWFVRHFERPTTFLWLLHYPPQPANAAPDAFGSAPHTDYGFLTILCQDSAGGLEVRRADGTWVVNVADMLSRWTNRRW